MGPQALQAPALELFSRKATAVATMCPGHSNLLHDGVEATELMFWFSAIGSIGLGLSILSYTGRVHFGLMGDAKRVRARMRDPALREGVRELMLIALMEDWMKTLPPAVPHLPCTYI